MNELERDLQNLETQTRKIKKAKYSKMFKQANKAVDKYGGVVSYLPIKYKGNPALRVHFNKGKGFTREKIESIASKLNDRLHDKGINGMMQISMQYDTGYRTGHFTNFGENVDLFDPDSYYGIEETFNAYNQSKFKKFSITLIQVPLAEGGDSKNNDCLYECLNVVLREHNPWRSPEKLKSFLGVQREAKVPISCLKSIEDKIQMGISVIGDYTYCPTISGNKCIYLKLIKEHYSIDNSLIQKVNNVSYKERKPIVYNRTTNEGYDGEKKWILTKEEMDNIRGFKTDYFLVNIPSGVNITLEDKYKQFVYEADELKKASKNMLNLYKTNNDITTALNLFDRLTKMIANPEDIRMDEALWINQAAIGSIIHFTEYSGEAFEYDVKSMYPSIMSSVQLFPLKRGDFLTITNDEFSKKTFYNYGIYRCIVKPSDDPSINNLFRFNKNNKYTHISLTQAKTLNLQVEMIEDAQPNFLYYSRDKCITGGELFGDYVKFMMPLKENKVPRAKAILNILWGALCEKNTTKRIVSMDDDYDIDDLKHLLVVAPYNKDDSKMLVENAYIEKYYKTNFARIAPFILAKGRLLISTIMKPVREHIKKVHTDGFMSDIKLDIPTGDKLGNLVYKGRCPHIDITSNARPKGIFVS
jgi:hypothetical protein